MEKHTHSVSDVENLNIALASKAPMDHEHDICEIRGAVSPIHKHDIQSVEGLGEALATKLDQNFVNSVSRALEAKASVESLSGKANVEHEHSFRDFGDMTAFMMSIRKLLEPKFNVNVVKSTIPFTLLITFTTTQGYSMSTVSINLQTAVMTSFKKTWLRQASVPFVEGQMRYEIQLPRMEKGIDFDYEIYLSDKHNPDLRTSSGPIRFTP